ncbi:hypothetical protein PRUPE_8G013300 [Prunus persica]|uniref:PPM-type phosphatase domain-containing protein n=1 Tax=Prunus persica TaxID=3760 RepID=A0A251MR43_PRUPE|nr:hypothetical protein PRUPE_8G013300 [Prunus persica]
MPLKAVVGSAFSLGAVMQGSAMDFPVSRVKGLRWRIILRQIYLTSMARWLHFLVFLMVQYKFLSPIPCSMFSHQAQSVRNYRLIVFYFCFFTCSLCLGHGGSRTAEYLKKNLFKNLSSHPNFIKDTKAAIVEVFKQTDVDYLNEEKGYQRDAGSTASTALLLGDRLFVANVGDSRVVGCRAGSAIPLSIDHKPDRSDERQRIEEAGGFIIWAGTWRVGGVLAVSRAFGDKVLKPFVVAEPEIQEEEIEGVDFIIIASDGLWNVISNKDAVALVQDIADAEEASRKLIQEAFARGSSDNITCVVVQFGISE